MGPFLNPVEQNNPGKSAVLDQIAASSYAGLWDVAWGEPLLYDTPAATGLNYDRVGLAIAAFEGSSEVNPFSSKYDLYLQGQAELTAQELWGKELFEGKAMCSACHMEPLFTDFTFDNLGVPKNPDNPFYQMDTVFLPDGSPINPEGAAWIDPGLGGFLATLPPGFFTALGLDKDTAVQENWGKHKVPTLRNVDKRPGLGFAKAYMHNGVFKSLKEVVHFYNTRDVEMWPAPEVAANVNTDELGDLELTDAEENAIVAFMATLSDGYQPRGRRGMQHISGAGPGSADLVLAGAQRGTAQISYAVAAPGKVQLRVLDVRGREVERLVSTEQAAGEYTVEFGGPQVASGQYLVELTTGRSKFVRKLTLMR